MFGRFSQRDLLKGVYATQGVYRRILRTGYAREDIRFIFDKCFVISRNTVYVFVDSTRPFYVEISSRKVY